MLTFDDIFGQQRAIEALRGGLRAGRLPHGLIFAGTSGVGKALTATALAWVFLCQNRKQTGDDIKPCGACESCRSMAGGSHPDLHIITKELIRFHDKTGKSKAVALAIDVIRAELIEPASRTAMLRGGKVFIIHEAEAMTTAAQNAMLKTLEEPAGAAAIVLLTDRPDALLQTVRSRCQLIRFAALDLALVKTQLIQRGVPEPEAQQAADYSDGSLGLALSLVNDQLLGRIADIHSRIVQRLSGKPADDFADILKGTADAYAERALERDPLASKDAATRDGLVLCLRMAANRYRAALRDGASPTERACAGIDALARAENYLDANVNIPVALQQLAGSL